MRHNPHPLYYVEFGIGRHYLDDSPISRIHLKFARARTAEVDGVQCQWNGLRDRYEPVEFTTGVWYQYFRHVLSGHEAGDLKDAVARRLGNECDCVFIRYFADWGDVPAILSEISTAVPGEEFEKEYGRLLGEKYGCDFPGCLEGSCKMVTNAFKGDPSLSGMVVDGGYGHTDFGRCSRGEKAGYGLDDMYGGDGVEMYFK